MADLLQSQFTPVGGLRSAFRTDAEENALAQAQMQEDLANSSALGQGLIRGLHQTPALLANTAAQFIEPFAPQFSQPIYDWAANENRTAQSIQSPAPQSYDQVNGVGDAVNLVAGAVGENLPQLPLTVASALAARFGLRNVAMSPWLKTGAGAMAASLPLNMGENVQSVRDDPVAMANSTAGERLAKTFGAAVPQAALDSVADTLLMGRASGLGKTVSNVFKDGLGKTAKDAALHIGKAVPEAALTEGLPEAGQEYIKQQLMSNLNPDRDTSRDQHEMIDSFVKGWGAGAPSSVIGRGTDVAWAQGRGATEAIRGLLTPKRLPESLTLSDDKDILSWDAQDNEQRNSWAKGLADSILNSDASQAMKEAATSFYDKLAGGARDAWSSLSDALGVEEKATRARDGVDHFLNSVRKANKAIDGKANAEADPLDQSLYDNFTQYLDPKGASARDTDLKSRLFSTVKESLLDDDWHNLPWSALEDEFGTIGRATDAVVKLRENLVRAGKLEHDDEFGKLFQASIKDGQAGERAMMDVVSRYGRDYISRKPQDSELRDVVRGLRNALSNPEWMRKNKTAFDAEMQKQFGGNAEKVIAALAPKNNIEAGMETEAEGADDTTGGTFQNKSADEFAPGTRFIGSGVKGLRKQVASDEPGQNIVANHGGFWALGHSDEKTRGEIQSRFKDTAADLRKDGHYVRELSPLEYAAEAGVSVKKVARHILGSKAVSGMSDAEITAALKDHPARMLAVDERDAEKDKLSLDHDDLLNLADKLKGSLATLDKGMVIKDKEMIGKIASALRLKGGEQRKVMKALGLEHGKSLRMVNGQAVLENNARHGGNGVFNVHMADGTTHHVSAQQLISLMRERGKGQFSSRSAYDMFNSGVAALMNIDGVEKITSNDTWGNPDDKPFDLKKTKSGKWKNYFQLEPGLTLGDAQKAARRGEFKDKVMAKLEEAYAAAEASGNEDAIEEAQLAIDEELARRDELTDQMEGEGQREAMPGSRAATDDASVTPGDHARETPLDFNDDGTPKHPYGKDIQHNTKSVALTFNGVPMRVQSGVNNKHFTEGARKVMAVAKALQKIKDSPTATGSRMDMALDLVARSAAAQKDGNTEARNAAIYAAADAIRQAALDEIEVAQKEGNEAAVDKLTNLAAKVIDLAAQYDPAKHDELLADYKPYNSSWKESKNADGKVATALKAEQGKVDDKRGQDETNDAVAADAKARAAADQAWMDLSEEERTEHVAKATKPVEQALTNLAKLNRSWGSLVKAVRQALRTLKEAWVNGELDKTELVKALRESVAALKAVAGDAANVLRDKVNELVKAYKNGELYNTLRTEVQKLAATATDIAKAAVEAARTNFNSAFAKEADAQRSKLINRLAAKYKGQFKSGMEVKSYPDGDIAGLGPYKTYMGFVPDAQQYQFMVVPDAVWNQYVKDFAAQNNADEALARQYLDMKIGEEPMLAAHVMVFGGSYILGKNYVGIQSALENTAGEAYLATHGKLGKEIGESGKEWNVLKGMGRRELFSNLGEFYARLQAITGKEDVPGNWNRDTGASKHEHRAGKLNAEGSFANGKGVTPEQLQEAKDYVAKVLGPKVKVELAKALGGNSAAWNRVSGEAIIRIAANAANPLSKAHHEAMHEFFQRLMEAHPEAAEVLRTAANAPMVKRQIEQFFHNDANYAKIKDAIANDEHERVAYMFQLWAAGKLNVGPNTKSWFQKVKDFLQKAFGLLSNDQKAEAIMQAFHDGKMSEPNAVAQVLANDPKMVQGFLDKAAEWAKPAAAKAKEVLYTAQNILSESGNKGFESIGKLFSTETGAEAQEMSFMDAKTMKTNQMNDRIWAILKGKDEKDIAAALEGLQRGETSKDADIAQIQQRLRTFLDQAHDYATRAGVDLKKVNDYFPRVWDALAIAENKAKFVAMLQADHFKETGKKMSEAVATGIADNLVANRGHEPVNEEELANGYSPFMASANKRVLDFIKNPEFSEFQEKSMQSIMTTYISQLVHKAEYTRRFGKNGDKLRDMVIDAVGEEVGPEWAAAKEAAQKKLDKLKESWKKENKALKTMPDDDREALLEARRKLGYRYGTLEVRHVVAELQSKEAKDKFAAFEPDLRRNVRAIMAMEGTLGADIDPTLRKWSSGLIVYENLRLLGMSLFSQVIDPLGVMVRGGTVGDAWDTFKRGIAGTIAGWRGKPIEDSATRLAMQLGIIDAGGFLNSQANAYTSLYMGKTAQKWNDRLFRVNGVEGFSQGTRVGAMNAAIEFLKHHSTLPSEHSERWLSELNLSKDDVKLVGGELDYANPKIQQAIFRWVEGAILRPNASMRPSWASDPHFALLFHLKQFTYAMQKVLLERVFNEAKHGNMDPGITMVLTYVPTMIAADFLRGLVANGGKEPPWKRNWTFGDYLTEGVQRAGLLGVPQFALDTAKWGPGELAGPVGEQLAKTGKTFYKDIRKDAYLDKVAGFTQAKKDIDRAAEFNGVEHAVRKTLRDAMPINSLTKRYIYDEVVGK